MIAIILRALIPIFFVIALGYFAGKHRTIDNRHAGELNALVMQFALPASLFVATATTARDKMLGESGLFLLLGITMMVFYVAWYLLQRRAKASHGEAAVQALTIALPNYAAAGLPIVLAPVLGTLVSLSGLQLDVLVTSSLQLIGQAAGGVALFLTGLVLSAQPFQLDRRVVSATLLSNIAAVAILLAALPSGFFGILFGVNYDVASREAGSMAIASTICSMVAPGVAILLLYPR